METAIQAHHASDVPNYWNCVGNLTRHKGNVEVVCIVDLDRNYVRQLPVRVCPVKFPVTCVQHENTRAPDRVINSITVGVRFECQTHRVATTMLDLLLPSFGSW